MATWSHELNQQNRSNGKILSIALCPQSVAVMDRQDNFTDTSTRISSMHGDSSVAVMDQQATFTDTSTRISSMEVALWLLWTDKTLSQILPPE